MTFHHEHQQENHVPEKLFRNMNLEGPARALEELQEAQGDQRALVQDPQVAHGLHAGPVEDLQVGPVEELQVDPVEELREALGVPVVPVEQLREAQGVQVGPLEHLQEAR